MNHDVYMYTGVTSAGSDQSNVGFILTNQRTKETKYYPCAGATEKSAQASAQGQVQHLSYVATFPLLLNISDQPTYFMPLKDAAGLVKMYSMVNVQQYQIVAVGDTVAECEGNYLELLSNDDIIDTPVENGSRREITGAIDDIRSSVIDGNTVYYISLVGDGCYYVVSAADSPVAPILDPGDEVTIEASAESGELVEAFSLERAG